MRGVECALAAGPLKRNGHEKQALVPGTMPVRSPPPGDARATGPLLQAGCRRLDGLRRPAAFAAPPAARGEQPRLACLLGSAPQL